MMHVATGRHVVGDGVQRRPTVSEHEQGLIARISKSMAMIYVRNTLLKDIHAGIEPVSHAGDFTDVVVIGANGRRVPWPDVSRIGNEEMGRLMRQVVNRMYTFQAKADDLHFVAGMDRVLADAWRWDEPDLDEIILSGTESSRQREEEEGRECGRIGAIGRRGHGIPGSRLIGQHRGVRRGWALTRRGCGRNRRSCWRRYTESDSQAFESRRFRDACAWAIRRSCWMVAILVKHMWEQGFARVRMGSEAGQAA